MKRMVPFLLLVALVVPGAFLFWGVWTALNRLSASFGVVFWARLWSLVYGVPWELTQAILNNEGASELHGASALEAAAAGVSPGDSIYPVGDLGVVRGPSFGPGQVERANVERLSGDAGLLEQWLAVASDPRDLALPGNERQGAWYLVKMLRETLSQAGGDLHQAESLYNGHGPAAEAYAERADAFRSEA